MSDIDVPRAALMAMAERTLLGMPAGSVVYFKFTCLHCGERCVLAEPNTLNERGECWRCGNETVIERGGFMLVTALRR
jgi:ribosomal protein S27AE